MGWFRSTKRNWGLTVLAVWLILTGIFALLEVTFRFQGELMAALAIVAGLLLLMGR